MKAYFQILGTLGLILLSSTANSALAQTGSFRQVKIGMITSASTFFVDNVPYNSTQIFRWQVGDVHTIRISKQQINNSFQGTNNGTPGVLGNDADLGVRTIVDGTYTVAVEGGLPVPSGAFQNLTNITDSDFIFRIQVWSFLQSIEFTSARQYRMKFVTPAAGCAPTAAGETLPGSCGDVPGYTWVQCADDLRFAATTGNYWCSEGSVEFTTVPAVGYAFKDWNSNPGLPNESSTGTNGSIRFKLNSPFHIQVNFGPGKFYRINTEPAGLEVVVDRSIVRTGRIPLDNRDLCKRYVNPVDANGDPININIGQGGELPSTDFCTVWLFGSTRLLGAPERQLDETGKVYVFDSWSFGGGQNALFEVSGANLSTNVLTARFLRAAGITFVTQPQVSLPLIVNNRTWPSYNFWFGLNKDVTYTAPPESVDASGRKWRFKGWSNGGPATQTMRITQEMVDKGLYLIALYEPLNKLSIVTNPPGLPISIDGRECPTPCEVEKLATESVSVSAVRSITQQDVLRLEFTNWTDGGTGDRMVSFNTESRRLVANYKQMYRLTTLGNPRAGVTFTTVPNSADQFFDLDTRVSVTARALDGYRFRRWSGDTAGLFPTASIVVGGPRTVVAELEEIPFIDPAGIKNAAGTGPQDSGPTGRVAPGSLITVFGVNLTPKEEIGPRSPQAQSLAEVAVRVGDRLLPLSFASGSQVNAQLPYDLPVGPNKITILRVGQPEVSADFEIVRNAPGLFGQYGTESEGTPPLVLAFRADGSVITESAPARPNEVINLIGTGLGGYRNNPPAGFAIPSGAEFALIDPVEVIAGDQTIQPLKVIAMPGFVGMTSVQIRVGPQFTVGASTNLKVRVNGKDSNTVRLFVR